VKKKRKQAIMRAGASDIYETYIENHFKILDEISLFSKKNEVLSERLKEMVAKTGSSLSSLVLERRKHKKILIQ
jgi:hypothetical protein